MSDATDDFTQRLNEMYKVGHPKYRCIHTKILDGFIKLTEAAYKQGVCQKEVKELFDFLEKYRNHNPRKK